MPTDQAALGDFVRPWNEPTADEKLFSRLCEVYAAFSEYTDVQIGRLIAHLKATGQYDNTIIMYCSDNGPQAKEAQAAL